MDCWVLVLVLSIQFLVQSFATPPDVVEPDAGVDSVTGEPEAASDDCFATAALTIRAQDYSEPHPSR